MAEENVKVGKIQRLIGVLMDTFQGLQVAISPKEIEDLAVVVHHAMAIESRNYHSLEHVFGLFDESDPLQSLAALFHDLVYYQVDLGMAPEIHMVVAPYIQEGEESIFIGEGADRQDRLFWMTLDLFGLRVGQELHLTAGLNEFLSALFMNKSLEGDLSDEDLLKATACIEATIPFREENERGENSFDILAQRLEGINQGYGLTLTAGEIEEAVKRAVIFSNNDVKGFAVEDTAEFLNGTWKLLPETNIALRSGEVYSIVDYRRAIQQMESFLRELNPENIFHRYRDTPSEGEFRQMVARARQNVDTACDYLQAKLLSIAILEALAELTGGDAPLSLFMGEVIREGEGGKKRMETYLPPINEPVSAGQSEIVKLLSSGRASDPDFDMRSSPTTLFMYQALGYDGIQPLLVHAHEMFAGDLAADEFLDRVDCRIVGAIAGAAAEMVPTRREPLGEYAQACLERA